MTELVLLGCWTLASLVRFVGTWRELRRARLELEAWREAQRARDAERDAERREP